MNKTTLLASRAIVLAPVVLQSMLQHHVKDSTFSRRHITAASLAGMPLSVSKLNVAAFAFGPAMACICARHFLRIASSLQN